MLIITDAGKKSFLVLLFCFFYENPDLMKTPDLIEKSAAEKKFIINCYKKSEEIIELGKKPDKKKLYKVTKKFWSILPRRLKVIYTVESLMALIPTRKVTNVNPENN